MYIYIKNFFRPPQNSFKYKKNFHTTIIKRSYGLNLKKYTCTCRAGYFLLNTYKHFTPYQTLHNRQQSFLVSKQCLKERKFTHTLRILFL